MYNAVIQKNADQAAQYFASCEEKLQSLREDSAPLFVKIRNPADLSESEFHQIVEQISKHNFALYDCRFLDKDLLLQLASQLGLSHLDHNHCADEESISSLTVNQSGSHQYYIPYTNRPLSWHTDGYYNTPAKQIRAFILHCVQPAFRGGENAVLDPDVVFCNLWQQNPDFVYALMDSQVLTIPENIEAGKLIRPAQTGPVFSFHQHGLHMRYSARKHNIVWKQDQISQQAVQALEKCIVQNPLIQRLRLTVHQGIISNNVLHNRTGFEDSKTSTRLYYRARYYDSIVS